ncbi:MAG: DNA-directed RNA polymerase subunit H [Candidatus Aenigmarchaeota archaeon]|nr:DNA-directed RNA polymerase subunit H [Candidatus Aenigmarchaeota archaeon]
MAEENEFNVLTHKSVPEHMILDEKETKELLDKFNIKAEQLPKILKNDPAAKAIDAKEGDVVKIIRKSHTAGVSVYYRFVVKK